MTVMYMVGRTYSVGNLELSWGLYFNAQSKATHFDLEPIALFLGSSLEPRDRYSGLIAVSCHQMRLSLDLGRSLCWGGHRLRVYAGRKSQAKRNAGRNCRNGKSYTQVRSRARRQGT